MTMEPRKKAYIETYGCQMNVSDSELMQGILAAQGYDAATTPEDADIILVNTCAIRDHAEQRVFGRVGELFRLKRDRPELVIGVTGCMAQRLGPSLLEKAPYVELVMGPDSYRQLPEVLGKLRPQVNATPSSTVRHRESPSSPAAGKGASVAGAARSPISARAARRVFVSGPVNARRCTLSYPFRRISACIPR